MNTNNNSQNGILMEEEEEHLDLDLELDLASTQPLPSAKLSIKKNPKLSIADNASLTYFTNPQYMSILQRKTNCKASDNSEEIKFYKKRIISLFKDILREPLNETVNVEIKEIHSMFVNASINYFQMIDTKDIIQGQHPTQHTPHEKKMLSLSSEIEETPEDLLNSIGGKEVLTVNDANELMLRKTITVSNLDNYVISNKADTLTTTNEMRFIPLKLEIDLKTNDLKKKGVKDKHTKKTKSKSKIKKEDLSNEIV